MRHGTLCAAALTAALTLTGCAGQQGMDAINRGDLNSAERHFTAAAQAGNKAAINNLGVVHERRGDRAQAVAHYTLAARWGDLTAQQNLVRLGEPVPLADLAAQRASQNAADTANTLMLMRALAPPPVIRPTVNCVSRRMGNQVYTDCN